MSLLISCPVNLTVMGLLPVHNLGHEYCYGETNWSCTAPVALNQGFSLWDRTRGAEKGIGRGKVTWTGRGRGTEIMA